MGAFDLSQFSIGSDGAALQVAAPHEDGRWISERISRLVEIIREYDPNIDVEWIPPDARAVGDPAFQIVENTPAGRFIMFYVRDEDAFDEGVLARIFQSDAAKHGFSLSKIDAHNDAVRAANLKERMEELEEAHDLAYHILKSPLSRYKHNGVIYE